MTKEIFTTGMAFLQEYFGKTLNDQIRDKYWDYFKDCEDDRFRFTLKRLIEGFQPTSIVPFPLIKDFKCHMDIDIEIYMLLIRKTIKKYGSKDVSFKNRAIHAAIERFGGWPVVCNWGSEGWGINEGRFVKALRNYIDMEIEGTEYLKSTNEFHYNETYVIECTIDVKGVVTAKHIEKESYGKIENNKVIEDLSNKFKLK